MIGADVEGGIFRRSGDVGNGLDATTDDGPEGVNQSDTVSILAVAPIPTHVIASADPHSIRSPGVHTFAIGWLLYVINQCLHVCNFVS